MSKRQSQEGYDVGGSMKCPDDDRPTKAFVQWLKKNPGVSTKFKHYMADECVSVSSSGNNCYIVWECNDEKGPFLLKRYICSSEDY